MSTESCEGYDQGVQTRRDVYLGLVEVRPDTLGK
jgi:hypothetical protein